MRTRSIAVVFVMTVFVGCGDSGSDSGGKGGAGGSAGGQGGRGGSGGSAAAGGSGGSVGSGGIGGSSSGGGGGSAGSAGGSSGAGGTGGSAATGGAGGTGDAGGKESGSGDGGNPSADTWASFGTAFMVKYCASCHNDDNSGVATRNYRMLSAVMQEKVAIACGTAKSAADRTARGCGATSPRARQFPVGNGAKPTDEERDRLLRWIDAGLP